MDNILGSGKCKLSNICTRKYLSTAKRNKVGFNECRCRNSTLDEGSLYLAKTKC